MPLAKKARARRPAARTRGASVSPSHSAVSVSGASSELVLFGAPIIPFSHCATTACFCGSVNNFLACNNPASYGITLDEHNAATAAAATAADRVVACVRKNANVVTLFPWFFWHMAIRGLPNRTRSRRESPEVKLR